jgi:23S rRNA pseudouridine1911/1915/1917 synthase
MPPAIEILYEDGPVIVVNKPAGLLTQAPLGIDNLEVRLKQFLKAREGKEGNIYLAVLHRIDRPVSGAIAFARHVRAARRISEQFEGRMVEKKYWALVEGGPVEPAGTFADYLQKLDGEARSVVVPAGHPEGKLAVLHYRVIGRGTGVPPVQPSGSPGEVVAEGNAAGEVTADGGSSRNLSGSRLASGYGTLLEIELETGRTHQIRVQCSSRGWPLLGDELYGSTVAFGPPAADARERVIALHARTLKFRHPMTKEPVEVVAPLPAYWPDVSV